MFPSQWQRNIVQQCAYARLATSQLHNSSLSQSGTDMWFLASKTTRPVPLPEVFVTTRPDPVPKSKTTTRQSLLGIDNCCMITQLGIVFIGEQILFLLIKWIFFEQRKNLILLTRKIFFEQRKILFLLIGKIFFDRITNFISFDRTNLFDQRTNLISFDWINLFYWRTNIISRPHKKSMYLICIMDICWQFDTWSNHAPTSSLAPGRSWGWS